MNNLEIGIIASSSSSPASVPGLFLWLRADVGVYSDSGKTTPAANGGTVACWADQSGHGYDAVQATSGARPTLATSAINGRPALSFNGSSDYLTSAIATLAQPSTVFFVFTSLSVGSGTYPPFFNAANGTAAYATYSTGSTAQLNFDVGGTFSGGVYSLSNSAYCVSAVLNNPTSTYSVNGAAASAMSAGTAGLTSPLTLGSGNTYFLNAKLAELLIYGSAVTGPSLSTVQSYLLAKYGVG